MLSELDLTKAVLITEAFESQPCIRTGAPAFAVLLDDEVSPGYGSVYDNQLLVVAENKDAGPSGPICDAEIRRLLAEGVLLDTHAFPGDVSVIALFYRHRLRKAISLYNAILEAKRDPAAILRVSRLMMTGTTFGLNNGVAAALGLNDEPPEAHARAYAFVIGAVSDPSRPWPPTTDEIDAEVAAFMTENSVQGEV